MEQNLNALGALTPEAATDEPASPVNPEAGLSPDPDEFRFASEAEEDAYWAGVCDGMANSGDRVPPRLAARARDSYPELISTRVELTGRARPDALDFDPVSTRHRIDGWTAEKQREYVEALADSGVARYAAARVGMSEQSASRLRRRGDARSFAIACEAAVRMGAQRIRSVAFERAIEGTIKRHYFHGELKSEERVFDNRLLIYLLGKVERWIEPAEESRSVADNWQPYMDAMEQGLPPPDPSPPLAPESESEDEDDRDEDGFTGSEVWLDGGKWWTGFPPPAGFDGYEEGWPGDRDYRRTLTEAEQAVVDSDESAGVDPDEELARQCARRDLYFGFAGDDSEDPVFSPKGPEPYVGSEPSGDSGADRPPEAPGDDEA